MIIDATTLSYLKNFSNINQSILFKKGNTISTMSQGKAILAKANVDIEFERDFGIYRLDKFLSILSFFKEPEIVLNDNHLVVKSGNHSVKIRYADTLSIVHPTKDTIDLPSVDVTLRISESDINSITKSFSVMELPEISFLGDGSKIYLQALNSKESEGDNYRIEIGETDKNFNAIFKTTNLKVIPGSYDVEICSKGISKFSNDKLTYWIAVENNSEF